jgi:TP901 family phage tail tape measure protein
MGSFGLDETKLKRVLELYKQITAQAQKMSDLNDEAKASTGKGGVEASAEYLEKQIEKITSMAITPEIHKQNMAILTDVESLNAALTQAGDQILPQYELELSRSTKEAEQLAKASSTIREIFAQFGITFTAATVVRGFQELARSAFDFYKSLDSALNQIYVVSSLNIEQVNKLQNSFINMAKNTGMSIDDVTKSAVLFYQQGLNTDAVLEMTRVTSQFAKVAGIDATDAADKLTAAVNGYCLAAEDAASVADKFNQVAASSAADINELSTAFSKAAAQANQAGVSMDNYLAYIATMEEKTREAPENIGTSLKTIFSRMQQIKTGENTEDNVDVNAVETALHSVGIALRDTSGQLRDLEEIFDELGPKWNQLDRNTQAYLGTIIAGTRQQSRFITLMQNWARVQELADESANSAGMQALMHAKAMDSIESKLQQFKVAWQEFVSNLASSDLFKGIIDALTKFINLINSGNKPMILLSLAIAAVGKKLKELQAPILNKVKDFAAIFTGKNKFTSEEEKKKALDDNSKQLIENNTKLNILYEQHKQKLQEIMALEEQMKNPENQTKENEDKINQLKQEQLELQNQINQAENKGSDLSAERKRIEEAKVMTKRQKAGSMLSAGGLALSSLGLASGDANTSGLLGGAGSALNAVGQGLQGNYIGAAVSAITAGYQLVKTFQD